MTTVVYNKLVRDHIPAIIVASGKACTTSILQGSAYKRALVEKMKEELAEYEASSSAEELADLYEVLLALFACQGEDRGSIEKIRRKKRQARGGFDQGIFLQTVSDPGGE